MNNFEKFNPENLEEPQGSVEFELPSQEKETIPLEKRVNDALELQERHLTDGEEKANENTLSGLKKWVGVATLMGASFLAVGCNSKKPK